MSVFQLLISLTLVQFKKSSFNYRIHNNSSEFKETNILKESVQAVLCDMRPLDVTRDKIGPLISCYLYTFH